MKKYFLWCLIALLVSTVGYYIQTKQTNEILLNGTSGICEVVTVKPITNKVYNSVEVCLLCSNKRVKSQLDRWNGIIFLEGDVGKYLEVKFLEEEPDDLVAVKILDTLPKDLSKYKGLPCSTE